MQGRCSTKVVSWVDGGSGSREQSAIGRFADNGIVRLEDATSCSDGRSHSAVGTTAASRAEPRLASLDVERTTNAAAAGVKVVRKKKFMFDNCSPGGFYPVELAGTRTPRSGIDIGRCPSPYLMGLSGWMAAP